MIPAGVHPACVRTGRVEAIHQHQAGRGFPVLVGEHDVAEGSDGMTHQDVGAFDLCTGQQCVQHFGVGLGGAAACLSPAMGIPACLFHALLLYLAKGKVLCVRLRHAWQFYRISCMDGMGIPPYQDSERQADGQGMIDDCLNQTE